MPAFLIRALIGAILSGVSLALFAPYVSLRKISYMGEALSHVAFAGIAIGIITGLNLYLIATVFVALIAQGIIGLARKHKLQEANTITIFLSVSMALGIVLISLSKSYSFDLASYLFGNVLLVTASEVWVLGLLALLNLIFIGVFYKELFYMSYNLEMAKVFKIKSAPVDRLFYLLLAVNIVFNLKTAGIILVTAQLILPAVIAFNLVRRLHFAIFWAVSVAVFSALCGFGISYLLNLPTGATIVLFEAILYALSFSIKKEKR